MAGYRFPNCYLRRPSTAVRCRISAGPRLIPQGKTLDGGYKADESGETWTHEGWDTLKFYEVLGFVVKWLIDRLQSRPRVRFTPLRHAVLQDVESPGQRAKSARAHGFHVI